MIDTYAEPKSRRGKARKATPRTVVKPFARLTEKELAGVSGGSRDIVMPTATIIVMPETKIVVKKPKH